MPYNPQPPPNVVQGQVISSTYAPPDPPPRRFNYSGSWVNSQFQRLPGERRQVQVPERLPGWLGDKKIILWTWAIGMIIVIADEHYTYGMTLPRPARLWYTSLFYFLCALLSGIDMIMPLVNIFAVGITLTLAIDFYQNHPALAPLQPGEKKAPANG